MSYAQQHKVTAHQATINSDCTAMEDTMADTTAFGANNPTVACYNRRSRILTDAGKAEWWIAITVLLLIVGIGFVVI
jgi:hypothetical protein